MVGKKQIQAYLESKKEVWAITTLRSEEARLNCLLPFLDGNPEKLWTALQDYKPYARVTAWTRVTALWSFSFPGQKNAYVVFRQLNARRFKNAYVRKPARFEYAELQEKIETIPDEAARRIARHLIKTGLRYSETYAVQDGAVVGKGGKSRPVLGQPSPQSELPVMTYRRFQKAIALAGLTSKDFRQVFATQLVRQGLVNDFDLLRIMGWSSVETARSYVAARKDGELKSRVAASL